MQREYRCVIFGVCRVCAELVGGARQRVGRVGRARVGEPELLAVRRDRGAERAEAVRKRAHLAAEMQRLEDELSALPPAAPSANL